MPDTTSTPAYPLWTSDSEPRLLASRANDSGDLTFPCIPDASPLSGRYTTVPLASVGHVYSFTVIHPGAKTGLAPYALGYVDLPGPVRIFARLQGRERPSIGDAYSATPDAQFGYVFTAVQGDAA